jgi:hypothetical protein
MAEARAGVRVSPSNLHPELDLGQMGVSPYYHELTAALCVSLA